MKILLFIENKNYYLPDELKTLIPNGRINISSRTGEIIDYIETNSSMILLKDYHFDIFKNNPDKIYYLQGSAGVYYIYNPKTKKTSGFNIVEVDTSKLWCISSNKDMEYIEYIDENENYIMLDKGLNYVKRVS